MLVAFDSEDARSILSLNNEMSASSRPLIPAPGAISNRANADFNLPELARLSALEESSLAKPGLA